MGREIERKFRVAPGFTPPGPGAALRQGYLSSAKERVVRVRLERAHHGVDRAWLTVKGLTRGASRAEFEYAIPPEDARAMLELCEPPLLEKRRYRLAGPDGREWEIDEFAGANEGLVVAEIELEHEDAEFARPDWLGAEVTDDPRYFNSNLLRRPYRDWSEE